MKFGLIGAGGIGRIRARAVNRTRGCRLVAVADTTIEVARKAASRARAQAFDSYERLLERADIDAVVVSTPVSSHEETVVAALESGKHVICESPLSGSVAGCRRMVETAERTGKVLTTGFNMRYLPAVRFVKDVLDTGVIGKLDHIRAYVGDMGLADFKAPWGSEGAEAGEGVPVGAGLGAIDISRYLMGEVSDVFGIATGNVRRLDGSEDDGFALMRGPRGTVATLHRGGPEGEGRRLHIEAYGEDGVATASYAPMTSSVVQTRGPGKARRRWNFYSALNLEEQLRGWQWTAELAFHRQVADFVAACDGGPQNIADGYSGLRAAEIANAIYRSARQDEAVAIEDYRTAMAEAV